jgi:putative SOS response-associated peptidase YedK
MCGRTALCASPEDLREAFGLDEDPRLSPRYNVPPSQPLDILRSLRGSRERRLERLRWGLVPYWAKDPKIGNKLALARAETVTTTSAFREVIRKRRCLVAVDGFFEWHRSGHASAPFFAHRADRRPFALAGVWDRWVATDGEVIESCALLTQPARAPLDAVHDRMPVVLEPTLWSRWLDPNLAEVDALLAEALAGAIELVVHPVSPHVNDPRHDDASCVTAVELPVPAQRELFS